MMLHALRKRLGIVRPRNKALSTLPFTSKTVARTLYLARLLDRVEKLPGAIVECGVGAGDTLVMIASVSHAFRATHPIIGFDSFQGLPSPTTEDGPQPAGTAGYLRYDEAHVWQLLLDRLGPNHGVRLTPGWFADTLPSVAFKIALLHLDCDLHDSYLTCFSLLTPHLLSGAIIAVDEYAPEAIRWPGAQKAIDDWCVAHGWIVQRDALTGKHFIVVP